MAKCKSSIEFGDDYGDNSCTFHCQLKIGHQGPCIEAAIMTGLEDEPDKHYGLMWVEMDRMIKKETSDDIPD